MCSPLGQEGTQGPVSCYRPAHVKDPTTSEWKRCATNFTVYRLIEAEFSASVAVCCLSSKNDGSELLPGVSKFLSRKDRDFFYFF